MRVKADVLTQVNRQARCASALQSTWRGTSNCITSRSCSVEFAQVVRVEDLQSLVEGIVNRALDKKATTGLPPSDGGGNCRDRPSGLVRIITVVYCNSPGG